VLFGKYSGQTVKVDGDELLVMKEEDPSSGFSSTFTGAFVFQPLFQIQEIP